LALSDLRRCFDELRARIAELEGERDAAKIELNDARNQLSVHPSHCPVTGRPFFMVIESLSGEMVATYGGPFDSYTIPEWNEGEFRSERYDHDMDGWVEGGEPYPFVRVDECFLNEHIATLQIIEGWVDQANVAKEFDGKKVDLDDRVRILMEQRDEALPERDAAKAEAEAAAEETRRLFNGMLEARAGEARAVEALRKIAEDADAHLNDNVLIGNSTRWRLKTIRACAEDATAQPALHWLAQREREAAARELEALMESEWKWEEFGLKASINARIAALTTQQPTACPRSEVRGKENNNA
jgi:pyruvate/2-oxoglutarate dehydrogenase complex dihydrolipoamide acyltransferase (E2) component